MINFRAYNHNNTLIGEYETLEEALKDANNYHYQTGNAYFLEQAEKKKYTVEIHETQHWTYSYDVEAESEDEAQKMAEKRHFEEMDADDSWLCESNINNIYIKEKDE